MSSVYSAARYAYQNRARISSIASSAYSAGRSTLSAMSRLGRSTPSLQRGKGALLQRNFQAGNPIVYKKGRQLNKRKRPVMVSKKLRSQVQKVMLGKSLQGFTKEIAYGALSFPDANDCKQNVVRLLTLGDNTGVNLDPLFSVSKIVDAASVLWNNKTQLVTKAIGDAGNFDVRKLKCTVIDSSATYHFRNNTQRIVFLRLMNISPKHQKVDEHPYDSWVNILTDNAGAAGPNQSATLITELRTTPTFLPAFNKTWNTSTTNVEIPPGGSYTHFVQGPKNWEFMGTKQFDGETFCPVVKQSIHVLAVYYVDQVMTTTGAFGRFQTAGPLLQQQVCYELECKYKLAIPEMAGFLQPAITAGVSYPATNTPLDNRQFSYAFKTYGTVEAGVIARFDAENPATAEPL